MSSLSLSNSRTMPAFGLGTWKAAPGVAYTTIRTALEIGYRHFDCAAIYGNEVEIGQAFRDAFQAGDVRREDLWITSKLWNDHHEQARVREGLQKTLSDLKLDYLDLYLVHWPVAFAHGFSFARNKEQFLTEEQAPLAQTWEAMAQLNSEGLAGSIGLSNHSLAKMDRLTAAVGVAPHVAQVEVHPFLPQIEFVQGCKERKIAVTAYSPLGSRDRHPSMRSPNEPTLLEHPTLLQIAEHHGASPAQVLIAWALHRGTSVIPKSSNPGRLAENFAAQTLSLSEEEIAQLTALGRGYRYVDGRFFCGNGSHHTYESLWA